ncbi:MAG: class I adenylate-forming enzyme family protein [Alphaproteobacteria bacterium]|nr:class I adenylate-forming enzyme family protein [Alphaproteobacteria bacterium]
MTTLLTLHDPATARRYYEDGLWRDDTLYSLMAGHAATRAGAFALRDSARRLTWEEVKGWTDAVADALHEAGIAKGQRISICLSNRVEAAIVLLACSRNGYVCNPSLHKNYTGEEILGLLQAIDAAAVFIEEDYVSDAGHFDLFGPAAELPAMQRVFRLPPDRTPGDDFPAPGGPGGMSPIDANPDKVTYLAFTSGTTGTPKGVMHSDNTLLANPRDLVRDWNHGPATVLLTLSPLSHHIAWVAVGQMMVAGGELVVDDPGPGKDQLDWIVECGATYVMGVPTHAMDILAEQRARGMDRLGEVKLFYMAGSPIPPVTAQAFLDQGVMPQNIYGMTENSSHQYTYPDDDPETIVHTCGRGGPGYRVRIFDAENPDVEVAQGEVGQIGGRGACLMLGYFGNQQATEGSFNRDGWFLSGDLGRLKEDGCLEFVGRLKDIVIRGGHNIHPKKIEDLAVKHEGVERAAAFAVPDERLGEKVCLAIVPAGGAAPEAGAVLDYLHGVGLSKYDMPEYFLALDEFPLTASGKILKRVLADWARDGEIEPAPVRFEEPAKEA